MAWTLYAYDAGTCFECDHPRDSHGGYHNDGRCGALLPDVPVRCLCDGYVLREVPNAPCAQCGHLRDKHSDPPYQPTSDICCWLSHDGEEGCPCDGYAAVEAREAVPSA